MVAGVFAKIVSLVSVVIIKIFNAQQQVVGHGILGTTPDGEAVVCFRATPVAATTIGANAAPSPTPTFVGNILDAAGISIGHFANLTGRALAFGGTVTTDAATITVPTCVPFGSNPANIPTLSEWAMILLAGLLAFAGFAALRKQGR